MENIPTHIAIIPDGSRRWAHKRGLPSFLGHREGAKTTERILRAALDLGIPAIAIWGSSVSNITKRSREEVQFLFDIFAEYFAKLADSKEVKEHDVRVRILGRWEELFPEHAKKPMRNVVEQTKHHANHQLTFLMAYSGVEEMLETIRGIAAEKQKRPELSISESTVKEHLWTKELPPVDLVIRTGGEPHWSAGFMMWDVAEARLHFTETLWPDFSADEFKNAVERFSDTKRRFGK